MLIPRQFLKKFITKPFFSFYLLRFALMCIVYYLPFNINYCSGQIIMNNGKVNACGGLFFDSGGQNGNYKPNENYTLTIYSSDPARSHVSLGFNELSLIPGDDLCFFDGKDTNAPLLGCASDFINNQNSIIEASAKNPSGAITVRFRSDGFLESRGWAMFIICVPSCQTVKAILDATSPVMIPKDTGYINACPNTTVINFKAHGDYSQNDFRYHQSDTLSKFEWNFDDGSPTAYGTNVSHVFINSGGYRVSLTVTDTIGCKNINYVKQRVRVAPKPSFSVGNLPNQLCVGAQVKLKGSASSGADTSYQVSTQTNTGVFLESGAQSGRLFIPDDSSHVYKTSIFFTSFSPGQVLLNVADLKRIFINIEHSWARDLEIKITCPNQQQAILLKYDYATRGNNRIRLGIPKENTVNEPNNDYNGDDIAGLIDSTRNPQGIGWNYNWVMGPRYTFRNFSNQREITLPAGNYAPEEPFTNLVGCPLNGEWSLVVKDQFHKDNGWIFGWGIEFAKNLYPTLETFQPQILQHNWVVNEAVKTFSGDSIVVSPPNAGIANFRYQVKDDYGCSFDTNVLIKILPITSPQCLTCNQPLKKLSDLAVCLSSPTVLYLDKTSLAKTADEVKFETFDQNTFSAATATIDTPFVSLLPVSSIFQNPIQNPNNTIDTVCFDISSFVASDLVINLAAPSGETMRLFEKRGSIGFNQIRNVCFSPTASTSIQTASLPFSGVYQPEGGAGAWNIFKNAQLTGNWKLQVIDTRGTNTDTLNKWSIVFKSGNINKYTWSPAAGLSCTNCALPIASPSATTQYMVVITDSLKCTYRDTSTVTVNDSLTASNLSVTGVTYHDLIFQWNAAPNAIGYQVSINGGAWTTPNGALQHTLHNLTDNQKVDCRVRPIGNASAVCGVRVSELIASTLVCQATIGKAPNRKLVIDSIACYGGTSPVVNFSYASGISPFIFYIDTTRQDANGYFQDIVKTGTHRAIFIDATGCSDTLSFSLGQPDSIKITAKIDSAKCFGGGDGQITVSGTGGTGTYTYSINNVLNASARFANLSAGKYKITLKDKNNCTRSDSFIVNQTSKILNNLLKADINCFGTKTGLIRTNVSGGTPPYLYGWSNNKTSVNIDSLSAGTYYVTVTDANNCVRTDTSVILQNPKLVLSGVQDSVKCFGTNTGSARASAKGGISPYLFRWSTNKIDSVIGNLIAGTYRVTASDGAGCSDTLSVKVLQPAVLNLDSLVATNTKCSGSADGSARAFVSGGTLPYTYDWSTGNSTTAILSNLKSGKYTLTVRDKNGCSKFDSLRLSSPTAILLPYFTSSSVKCNGNNNGKLKINVSGGTLPYSYLWNTLPAQTTDSAVLLRAGKYTVTVTDANSCTATKDTQLLQPSVLKATFNQKNDVTCKFGADGNATITAVGGIPFSPPLNYIYRWNDSLQQNNAYAINLKAGTYTAYVNDANGCTDSVPGIFVNEPATAVKAKATAIRLACFGQNNGAAQVTATGGAGSYIYRWNNLKNSNIIQNITRGQYTITVTDFYGCSGVDTINIDTYDSIQVKFTAVTPLCYGNANGSIAVTNISGGGGGGNLNGYFYQWNTLPVQSTVKAANLVGNKQYQLRVIDSLGCENIAYQYLSQPGKILLNGTVKNISCFNGNDGEAQVNAAGSFNQFKYLWGAATGAQTTQRAVNLKAGRYPVTVTDSTGCKTDTVFTISEPQRLKITNKITGNTTCVGDTSGKIMVSVSGGIKNYKYAWSSGDTTSELYGLRAGTYILVLQDANGCVLNDTTFITAPKPIEGDVIATPVKCYGSSDGAISISIFGGTPPYTYSLDGKNYNGNDRPVGLRARKYDIYVRDANNCLWFDNVEVKTPPLFTITSNKNTTLTLGDSAQLFVNPSNNQGSVDYSWKMNLLGTLTCTNCQTPFAKPYFTTTYAVFGLDSVGCRASDSVVVTVLKPRGILVPTGFTPNGDLVNDKLIVHGRAGTKIVVFRVYDRWGELLYEAHDFNINDEASGWDGSFKGQTMNSGLYVWYIEAEYIDGAKETLKGSTTLIR